MPSFELDGKTVEFEPGEKILSAAMRAGIQIPHYCYHPGMSVVATCRMCMEEDESSFHVIAECPTLAKERWDIFHQTILSDTPNWSLKQVTRFLRESPIGGLLDQHG